MIRCLAGWADAVGFNESEDSNCDETKYQDSSDDVGNYMPAFDPDIVVESQGLECAPETVSQVEPQGYEPDDVKYKVVPF